MSFYGKSNPSYRHGHASKTSQSSEYMRWSQMIQRCHNPNSPQFADYGGRGIIVCERWMDFRNFIDDLGACPPGFTLERSNNALGYCPENCKWASRAENARNKRNNIWLTINGVTMIAKDWSKQSCVSYRAIVKRLRRGWDAARAVNTPSRAK